MINELKKLLAECHVKAGDRVIEFVVKSNIKYLLQRIEEELWLASEINIDDEDRMKRCIQLLNIIRYKIRCNRLNQEEQLQPDQKPKSNKT